MKRNQMLNWIGLVVVLAVNTLANSVPLGGMTTGEISDSVPTLFTPAGYVFSIWGLIYLGLLGFAWYQGRSQERGESVAERIGYGFVASCVFNSIWIVLWHYQQFSLSLLAMLGLLASLVAVYLRLDIGRRPVTTSEKRWVHLPFSIYLGWISVATIANVSAVLYALGWSGGPLSPHAWTTIMVSVAAVLGLVMILLRNEVAFPLVIAWALIGIAIARASTWSIAITAGIAAVTLVVVLVIAQLRSGRQLTASQ